MIRRSTRTLIEQTVAGHVGIGNAFTAFDVTRELRSQGVQVVHEAAKRVVHGLYFAGAMPGYARDLRPMGGPVPAFVYFPQTGSADAGAYDLNGLRALMSAADLRATSSLRAYHVPPPARPGRKSADPIRRVDRRGTICVPARLTRALGLQPGDRAFVAADPQQGKLDVSRSETVAATSVQVLRSYRVDKHANIRITHRAQRDAGLDRPAQFHVCADGASIVLRPLEGEGALPVAGSAENGSD